MSLQMEAVQAAWRLYGLYGAPSWIGQKAIDSL